MARLRFSDVFLTFALIACMWASAPRGAIAQSGVAAETNAPTPEATPAQIKAWDDAAARMGELVDAYRERLNRSDFDIDALGESLDFEAEQIGRFVHEQIAYEVYPGLLRGALGSLTAGAGNALDQSVLMASLLQEAGLTARIASAQVGPAVVERLAAALTRTAPPPTRIRSDASTRALVFDGVAAIPGLNSLPIVETAQTRMPPAINELPAFDNAKSIARELTQSLGPEAMALIATELQSRQARDMATHYWVEYRELPSDPWTRLDPVLGAAPSAADLAGPVSFIKSPVPADLLHRIRVEVHLLVNVNARAQRREVATWEVTAANQAQRPMSLQIGSIRVSNQGLDQVVEEGLATDIFIPVFNGVAAPNGFDTAGTVVPTAEAATAAGALFATTSGAMRRAEQALANPQAIPDKNAPEAVIGFDAVEITYTLFSPHARPKIEQRQLINIADLKALPGPFAAQFYRQLTRQHSLFIATGRLSDAQMVDAMLARQQTRLGLARAVVSQNRRAMARQIQQRNSELNWLYGEPLLRLFDQMDQQRNVYRSAPTLLVHHRSLPVQEQVIEGTDIVFNERRLRLAEMGAGQLQPLIETGGWESMIEGVFLDGIQAAATAWPATPPNYQRIDDAAQLAGISVADNALLKRHMTQDLTEGYRIVVADPLSVDSPDGLRYWRIGPDGSVVAVGETGEGNAMGEYTAPQQALLRTMCTVTLFGACANAINFAKPTGVLIAIGASAEEIQVVILGVNAILAALGMPSLDIPEGAELGGAVLIGAGGSLVVLEAIKRQFRQRCAAFAARKCFAGI